MKTFNEFLLEQGVDQDTLLECPECKGTCADSAPGSKDDKKEQKRLGKKPKKQKM